MNKLTCDKTLSIQTLADGEVSCICGGEKPDSSWVYGRLYGLFCGGVGAGFIFVAHAILFNSDSGVMRGLKYIPVCRGFMHLVAGEHVCAIPPFVAALYAHRIEGTFELLGNE